MVLLQVFSLNVVLTPFITGYFPNYFYLWHTMVIPSFMYCLQLLFHCIIRNASVYFPIAGTPIREIAGTISSLTSATLPHSSHSSTFGHHGKLAACFL